MGAARGTNSHRVQVTTRESATSGFIRREASVGSTPPQAPASCCGNSRARSATSQSERSCCHPDACLLVPDPKGAVAGLAILVSSHQLTGWTEVAVDHGLGRQETLCLLGRLKAPHLLFKWRLVRCLNSGRISRWAAGIELKTSQQAPEEAWPRSHTVGPARGCRARRPSGPLRARDSAAHS